MKYAVVLWEGEDGWLIAECPAIPGCLSQGRTEEEALANINEAIRGCLEDMEAEAQEEAERHSGRVLNIEVAV